MNLVEAAVPTVAVVAFSGAAPLWWLHLLRPGFRHCFVLVRIDSGWLLLDPLSHRIALALLPAGADPAAHYRALGHVTLTVPVALPPRRPAPFAPFTCVEAVKRVLGLHDRFVLTPWQLFRRLLPLAAPEITSCRAKSRLDFLSE